jgi:hypothetical protein
VFYSLYTVRKEFPKPPWSSAVLLQRNQATLLYKHTKLNSLSAIFSLHSCREAKKNKKWNYYYRIRVRVISNDTNSGVGTAAEEEDDE